MSREKDIKLSICIATYNMKEVLWQTIEYIKRNLQLCEKCYEIIIYDDCSTDGTDKIPWLEDIPNLIYRRAEHNRGVGEAFNRAINLAKGKYVMTMCADDLLIDNKYVTNAISFLDDHKHLGYFTRHYYQYVGWDDEKPVRAWRTDDPVHQANNPSGLIFRRKALKGFSNKMFIESSFAASNVVKDGWGWAIYPRDAIAVRVWDSTSTKPGYYLKRRVSSPVMDWHSIGVDMSKDYVSLLQIKNGHTLGAVWEEILNFVRLRPMNLLSPFFWFYAALSLLTPRFILRKIPKLYRKVSPLWVRRKLR